MEIKELLEKAARTLLPKSSYENKAFMRGWFSNWNPATDDGDCARMEAKLDISVEFAVGASWVDAYRYDLTNDSYMHLTEKYEDHGGDKQAARRMASLRVAAAIYESMG